MEYSARQRFPQYPSPDRSGILFLAAASQEKIQVDSRKQLLKKHYNSTKDFGEIEAKKLKTLMIEF